MDRNERANRLKAMLAQVADDGNIESLMRRPTSGLESMSGGFEVAAVQPERQIEESLEGLHKITHDATPSDAEMFALEAIVLPRERPVVFIQNDSFGNLPSPWSHFASSPVRTQIEAAIPSVGRIELPESPLLPYGGTGFVVGDNLLMTNRHVAELFAQGLGIKNLTFRTGQRAEIDFKREANSDSSLSIQVKKIVMIHPHWDMAILQVEGLPAGHGKLTLAVDAPEDLNGREVAVIGYPARDVRNDLELQDRIFNKTYNVKRLHPGKLRQREMINSFGKLVNAMTHDSSTLGGNSGSAVIDSTTGRVVGLHFAGVYLKANYCVPSAELARDSRVVDAGLNFNGSLPATDEWLAAWRLADPESAAVGQAAAPSVQEDGAATASRVPVTSPSPKAPSSPTTGTSDALSAGAAAASWTIPLHLTISIGSAVAQPTAPLAQPATPLAQPQPAIRGVPEAALEKVPVIYPKIEEREGYQEDFLDFEDGLVISLPTLTAAGKGIAAKLDDGSHVLNYHKFSLVMHKRRRLALFTAANVDWRPTRRTVDGRKPTRKELDGFEGNEREDWVTDSRIPQDHQLPDYFYTKDGGSFDKGHLVRRDDVAWGKSFKDMQKGNGDTFHTTNCSPQTAEFNRSNAGEFNWGALENMVQQQTKTEKVCVFSGPVLADEDAFFRGLVKSGVEVSIQIPSKFWKIIVAKNDGQPAAFGFVLEQELSGVDLTAEMAIPNAWKKYTRRIAEIEDYLNGFAKLTQLKKWDQYEG